MQEPGHTSWPLFLIFRGVLARLVIIPTQRQWYGLWIISRKIASVFLKCHHLNQLFYPATIFISSFLEKREIYKSVGPWSIASLWHPWIRVVKDGDNDGRWGRNLWNFFVCNGRSQGPYWFTTAALKMITTQWLKQTTTKTKQQHII